MPLNPYLSLVMMNQMSSQLNKNKLEKYLLIDINQLNI